MARLWKIALGLLLMTGLLLTLPYLLWRLSPSSLHVRVVALPHAHLVVESSNLSGQHQVDAPVAELRLTPISHGVYRIRIDFTDGQVLWCEFLHHDAGDRRRIDIVVQPSERPGYVRFTQKANGTQSLFTGETTPSATSAEKPFQLDWI